MILIDLLDRVTNFVLVDEEGYQGEYLKKGSKFHVYLVDFSCLLGISCSG